MQIKEYRIYNEQDIWVFQSINKKASALHSCKRSVVVDV